MQEREVKEKLSPRSLAKPNTADVTFVEAEKLVGRTNLRDNRSYN